jgi:uncharacterized membrane protein YeaQ/YmgE (transglycosylase-associated protein family)
LSAEELRDVLKGKKEIGVTVVGSYKPEWMRARDEDPPVAPRALPPEEPKTPTPPMPKDKGPKTPGRSRLPLHKDQRIRSSGVHERIQRIEKHSGIARSRFEPEGGRAVLGLLAGIIAGMILTLIGRNTGRPIPYEMLFQLSWMIYGVMMGIAAGIAKRRALGGLVSVALGLVGGASALFLLKFLGGLESLRDVDPIYFSFPCAITLGIFLGISDGLYEKSPAYSLQGLAWAALGGAIAAASFLGVRHVLFAYWRSFLDWIVLGALLGFFLNFLASFARKSAANGEPPQA